MRKLTLDEKIGFKGIFAHKGLDQTGLDLPRLNMAQTLFFFGKACGYHINKWPLYKGR